MLYLCSVIRKGGLLVHSGRTHNRIYDDGRNVM